MVVKDWTLGAARAIQKFVGFSAGEPAENLEYLRVIINQHCPFKVDVAYMPVPRCDSCAHWTPPEKHNGHIYGVCKTLSHTEFPQLCTVDEEGMFCTLPNFGCKMYEIKS